MGSNAGDLHARLDALAGRLDASLARVRGGWIEQSEANGDAREQAELQAKLEAAEASARLQAMRCSALEDRVAELEAALVGAREQRASALAAAEQARANAERALDELERARAQAGSQGDDSQAGASIDAKLNEALQAKLLEVERLASELASLRRSNEDWRGRARSSRRELDRVGAELERANKQLTELRERDESARKRLAELDKTVAEQRRELELAQRRAEHLRARLSPS